MSAKRLGYKTVDENELKHLELSIQSPMSSYQSNQDELSEERGARDPFQRNYSEYNMCKSPVAINPFLLKKLQKSVLMMEITSEGESSTREIMLRDLLLYINKEASKYEPNGNQKRTDLK